MQRFELDDDYEMANDTGPFQQADDATSCVTPPSTADTSSTFLPNAVERQLLGTPQLVTPEAFMNFTKELGLSKDSREKMGSWLKSRNLVTENFRVTMGRKRALTQEFDDLFLTETLNPHTDDEMAITYCWDIDKLFEKMKQKHIPAEWRLFIDGSSESLKVVLLHITNKHPSVPIAYACDVKEDYDSMKAIIDLIQYNKYKWLICCDLKVVGLLIGLKKGYPTNQCFICLWEGRHDAMNYDGFPCAPRLTYQIGKQSIDHLPLVDPKDVILPPLHLKLGLVRNFTKAIERDSDGFKCLTNFFKRELSLAKIENGK